MDMQNATTEQLLSRKPIPPLVRDEIIRRFRRFCHKMAVNIRRQANSEPHGDHEDWYQDACIFLVEAMERYDPGKGCKFITYATVRVWGKLRSLLRADNGTIRIPAKWVRDPETVERFRPSPFVDDIARIERDREFEVDEIDALSEALATLTEKSRRILLLRFFDGLTYEQIGTRVGLSRARVCQRVEVSLDKLRGKFGSIDSDERRAS